jgi:molybdate transport system permease protein
MIVDAPKYLEPSLEKQGAFPWIEVPMAIRCGRRNIGAVEVPESFPIMLSLRVAALALVFVTPVGIGLALLQARRRYPGRSLVDAGLLLPLVLPPSVIGYFLVLLFGRHGWGGRLFEQLFGLRFVFTSAGAVLAAAVVALPILVKTAQPSIEAVPKSLEDVARSLGLRPWEVLLRVTLPLSWRGIVAAVVLAFARAIGEFGATLMLAGHIRGRTNTMSLEIFAALQEGDEIRAGFYVAVLSLISIVVVLLAGRLGSRDVSV